VKYLPATGKYKVYIIDEVHMLSTSAFNALLKTLEEPPPHVIFVFATTEVHKIPPTILSRCQRFDFRRIAAKELVVSLGEIAKKESWVDNELDEYQKKLGETEDNVVIDSRIGFYFIPHSVKILLDVDLKEGSKRIFNDQRSDEESRKTAEDMLKAVKKRMELEKERYKKYYNIDYQDSGNFDYVIDTTHITAEQVSEKIVRFIKTRIAEGVKNVLKNNH